MGHIIFWYMLLMLMGKNIKNTDAPLGASKEVGPEVNAEKP
jgi:hypothetical protein